MPEFSQQLENDGTRGFNSKVTSILSKINSTELPEQQPQSTKQPIIWRNVFLLTFIHILAVYGAIATYAKLKTVTWIWCFSVGSAGGLGVTGGAHRLWTHRAYKATLPLRIILIICYSIAGHNPLFDWVRDHRVHHKFSETDADPHNAKRGFFFAHVGWLMMRKHPEVIAKGRLIDVRDVLKDPVVVFHRDYFVPMQLIFCFVLPTLVPWYLWGENLFNAFLACGIVRYVIGLNCTWLVNSAAHIWGNKPYDKRIMPAENKVVSFMSLGEGWHNYHHVFPWDYKAAELGGNYILNFTTFWIDFFALFGWAYDRNTPATDLIIKTARRHGDGTYNRRQAASHPTDLKSR